MLSLAPPIGSPSRSHWYLRVAPSASGANAAAATEPPAASLPLIVAWLGAGGAATQRTLADVAVSVPVPGILPVTCTCNCSPASSALSV